MVETYQGEKYFVIQEAPSIPGLRFRYFRGEKDYPLMKSVFDSCKEVDGIEYALTEEAIAHNYQNLQRSDPFKDLILAELDGEPIAYSRVGWYPEEEGDYIYYALGWIKPEWRKKGIGTAILMHNERRLRLIANEHPENVKRWFQNDYEMQQEGVAALLKANGYEEMRWGYRMGRPVADPLPEAPMPESLEVRPVNGKEIRQIWEAMYDAFSESWGFVAGTEEDYRRFLSSPTHNPELWKVAWDGDEVAGMVLNFVNEAEYEQYGVRRGWTDPVCVRKPWRRQGLARSLLVQSILMFREMGYDETNLGVDSQNRNQALNLYESVGYMVVRKGTICRKPMEK